jgi:hypothetical protein
MKDGYSINNKIALERKHRAIKNSDQSNMSIHQNQSQISFLKGDLSTLLNNISIFQSLQTLTNKCSKESQVLT